MTINRREMHRQLYSIAESQYGYFTTKQAVGAGYKSNIHPYHVRVGNWIRIYRGIYRLSCFPGSEKEHYMIWYLWSRNRKGKAQGIYSHHTALSIYNLSDIMPSKIHMTVPKTFRRHSELPGIISLHFRNIEEKDTLVENGVRITSPVKTIKDLYQDQLVTDDIISQSVTEGLERGLFTKEDIKQYGLQSLVKS